MNSLLEENRLDELGLIVVDEVHLVGDEARGTNLEIMLTKLLHLGKVQIVAMSATIANLGDLASWLRADIFEADFRPVPLVEHLVRDNVVEDSSGKVLRELDSKSQVEAITSLCLEVIPHSSVLIFEPTKRGCIKVAHDLASFLGRHHRHLLGVKLEEKQHLCGKLKSLNAVDPAILPLIPLGIAFHNRQSRS